MAWFGTTSSLQELVSASFLSSQAPSWSLRAFNIGYLTIHSLGKFGSRRSIEYVANDTLHPQPLGLD